MAMTDDAAKIDISTPPNVNADELRKIARIILQRQFIVNQDRGMAHAYELLRQRSTQQYFDELFDALGFDFFVDEERQVAGILPRADLHGNAYRLSKDDTIMLLLLAQIWYEIADAGGLDGKGCAITDSDEIIERLADLTGDTPLNRTTFTNRMRLLQRRGLVRFGTDDRETDTVEVLIRPHINRVTGAPELKHIEEELARYNLRVRIVGEEAQNDEVAPDGGEEEAPRLI